MKTQLTDPTVNLDIDGVTLTSEWISDVTCDVTWDATLHKGVSGASIAINVSKVEISYTIESDRGTMRDGFWVAAEPDEEVELTIINFAQGWEISAKCEDGLSLTADIAPIAVDVDTSGKKVVVCF